MSPRAQALDPDRSLLLEQGYVIFRAMIPPDQVAELRRGYERGVERHQARNPELWSTSAQPRMHLDEPGVVDRDNPGTVQFWCSDDMLDRASRLLAVPDPAPTRMMLMCSPRVDRGPTSWHRDTSPLTNPPLGMLVDDVRENGPRRVQWNIPLHDDAVLWVVPGSHLRLNSEPEKQQLLRNPSATLPGAIPVELRAGDAVAYINYILHWGSDYSARLRRTIHGGHSASSFHRPLLR